MQHTVFVTVDCVTLTAGAVVAPFLRSGMSALLGLLALPRMGLEGGAPRLPGVVGLRSWTPLSSLVPFSAVVVWLRFGWAAPGGFWPTTEGKKTTKMRQVTAEDSNNSHSVGMHLSLYPSEGKTALYHKTYMTESPFRYLNSLFFLRLHHKS